MKRCAVKVGIYTLGCKVNQYESEAIAECFAARGCTVVPASEVCDVYVINTCTVTAESDRKARQFIRRAHSKNKNACLLVTGCMAQTAADDIARIEGVDYICGNTDKLSVVDKAFELIALGRKNPSPEVCASNIDNAPFEKMSITKFDRTRAYVKIEDGCESRCTYCIIPAARGKIRSKSPSDVIAEVEALTRGGCREVVLTGIETASYGKDLGEIDLADLLCKVDKIEGIGRVRLGSLDPSLVSQKFVDKIAGLKHVSHHFHLSLQSGSSRILALMKRKYNADMALAAIERLRAAMPDVQLTTDVIVGFPGETEEDFAQTLEFAKKARFLQIHIFPYSKRKGTPAATMPAQIDKQTKHERLMRLSELEADIRREILKKEIRERPVTSALFETYENGLMKGHTDSFIEVCVPSPTPLRSEIKGVRLTHTDGEFVFGELLS